MLVVNRSVAALELYKCGLGDAGMLALVDAMHAHTPPVTLLDIGRHVWFHHTHLTPHSNRFGTEAVQAVAALVRAVPLQCLRMRACDIRPSGAPIASSPVSPSQSVRTWPPPSPTTPPCASSVAAICDAMHLTRTQTCAATRWATAVRRRWHGPCTPPSSTCSTFRHDVAQHGKI